MQNVIEPVFSIFDCAKYLRMYADSALFTPQDEDDEIFTNSMTNNGSAIYGDLLLNDVQYKVINDTDRQYDHLMAFTQ